MRQIDCWVLVNNKTAYLILSDIKYKSKGMIILNANDIFLNKG